MGSTAQRWEVRHDPRSQVLRVRRPRGARGRRDAHAGTRRGRGARRGVRGGAEPGRERRTARRSPRALAGRVPGDPGPRPRRARGRDRTGRLAVLAGRRGDGLRRPRRAGHARGRARGQPDAPPARALVGGGGLPLHRGHHRVDGGRGPRPRAGRHDRRDRRGRGRRMPRGAVRADARRHRGRHAASRRASTSSASSA